MALKHGILGLLSYSEMTGYDLMKTFDSSLAYFWHVRTSQIYLELDKLSKAGLVEFRKEIQESRPNKNIFKITDDGKKELINWLNNSDIQKMINVKDEFLMLVFFLNELPKKEAIEVIKRYKKECEKVIESLIEANKNVEKFRNIYQVEDKSDVYWGLTVKYGEFISEASLKWADYAIKIIENKI